MPSTDVTPLVITAIAGAVVSIIAALSAAVVAIIAAMRSSAKMAEVSAKADLIKDRVDGTASASAAKIDALQQRVDHLTSLLSDSKQTAAVLAESTANRGVAAAAKVEIVSPAVLEVTGPDGGPVLTTGVKDDSETGL